MVKSYQLSIATDVAKGGKRVAATVDKACSSSGGSNCIPASWCRVCIGTSLDFTFGGTLAGLGTITLDGVDQGSYWEWKTPFPSISTSCGNLSITFTVADDGATSLQVNIAGTIFTRASNPPRVCQTYTPGDPTEFIYPQALVDGSPETGYGPEFTVTSGTCTGTASCVVTNTGSGSGSGSRNPYDFAVDTLITKTGRRVLAAINCSGSGGSSSGGGGNSVYWYGTDTGVRKNGKRVLTGYNPCCSSDPTFNGPRPIAGCCELPPVLYVTFPASMAYLGTMTLTLQTDQRCDNYQPGDPTEPNGPAYAGTIASSACGKVWGCLNCIFRVSTSVSHYIFYFGYGDPPAYGSISSGGWECFLYACDPVYIVAPVSGKNASCNAIFDYAHITETAP